MVGSDINGVEFWIVNTDSQAMATAAVPDTRGFLRSGPRFLRDSFEERGPLEDRTPCAPCGPTPCPTPCAPPMRGAGAAGISRLAQTDRSPALVAACAAENKGDVLEAVSCVVADEEARLPFDDEAFDVVLSSLNLNWVNDLPRALSEVRRVLKPDGVFVGALLGAGTLGELQYAFAAAEEERTGGVSPHCSPAARLADCGQLLQRAGFQLITVDVERIQDPERRASF